ncbi:unnamed protein product [Paramecium pentaurelia]|uniref:Intron-binding protein aquarius n=1 Tax=Paramecium pentaurelia TaxID=43138 RepID=A0A8S1U952_9CILI|nr:unnamed protein product [Paramecium pentaurelia]
MQIEAESNINIQEIYQSMLIQQFNIAILRQWEKEWLLENYLFPQIKNNEQLSQELVFTTIAILNLKQLEQINIQDSLQDQEILLKIFNYITKGLPDFKSLQLEEKQQVYTFLMQLFCMPETQFVQKECYKYLSQALLLSSNKIFLKWHFLRYPKMVQSYMSALKVQGGGQKPESLFIPNLVQDMIQIIFSYPISEANFKENEELIQIESQNQFRTFLERNSAPLPTPKHIIKAQNEKLLYRKVTQTQMRYLKCIEKFVDFMILLLSSIPTRKFLKIYLLSTNILPYLKCTLPQYHSCVLQTLVQSFEHYLTYPINDQNGEVLSLKDQQVMQKDFLKKLQTVLYKQFKFMVQQKELEEYQFIKNLRRSEIEKLFQMMVLVFPVDLQPKLYEPGKNFDFLIQEVMKAASPPPFLNHYLKDTPIIPNEQMIWDYKHIPEESKSGVLKQVLALPKLNLQFLCFEDYLERNYKLFKLESAFDLRKDFEDTIIRMDPKFDQNGAFIYFSGWAKAATEVIKFRIHEVQTPEIGKRIPRRVYGEIQYSVERMAQNVRKDWDSLKKHQVVFLISFRKEIDMQEFQSELSERQNLIDQIEENEGCKLFCEKYGIRAIRGAEIELVYDERRREILDWEEPDPSKKFQGNLRILHVFLDQAQYQDDIDSGINAEGEIYGNFKLLVKRNPKENNFKAILGSIQQVILQKPQLPKFLDEILLGYGVEDISSSQYYMKNHTASVNFSLIDTVLDQQHYDDVIQQNSFIPEDLKSKITFGNLKNRKRVNNIRYTKPQINAIVSAMYPGLTLVVGPPGTGKTDVTVQIVNLLYQNFPNEKTLLITHSNHALNDIFQKISKMDVDEKHMLRLGIGVKDLKLSKTFSREGRINHMLTRRLQLLEIVSQIQKSVQIMFSEEYSCEVSEIFFKLHIQRLWNNYKEKIQSDPMFVFPFNTFVEQNPQLFEKAQTKEEQYKVIEDIFEQVRECRPFELLRNKKERGNYIICHQAKIVAMTCTHAALKRNSFCEQDFQYDNIVFEEAGQILEIEAFLPLTMSLTGKLKRLIMIGDHNQLPPVIKNVSFQKLANMEQSFFIRMIRLGVFYHQLTDQGRTRPEIMKLYSWKYKELNSLQCCHPSSNNQFGYANAGLCKTFQFIDVDYKGVYENKPMPYFYQNIVEAEFIVATYMYLVLRGYDPKQITILTTYNGQKMLIKDIITRKCSWHSLFRTPEKITTVDKFQGQQNDIILISMVRTSQPGYLRDIRRIIVAFSRAKLGLYIFGNLSIFNKVPELQKTFSQFVSEPLHLLPTEMYKTKRAHDDFQLEQSQSVNHPDQMYEIIKTQLIESQRQNSNNVNLSEVHQEQESQSQ